MYVIGVVPDDASPGCDLPWEVECLPEAICQDCKIILGRGLVKKWVASNGVTPKDGSTAAI